jgi:hypothetical protein
LYKLASPWQMDFRFYYPEIKCFYYCARNWLGMLASGKTRGSGIMVFVDHNRSSCLWIDCNDSLFPLNVGVHAGITGKKVFVLNNATLGVFSFFVNSSWWYLNTLIA